MFTVNYNPCYKRRQEKLSQMPKEVVSKIDEMWNNGSLPRLIKLKRNRKPVEIRVGDVFLASNHEGIHYYGKIVAEISPQSDQYDWLENDYVVFIFNCKTTEKNMSNYVPNYGTAIMGPELVNAIFWEKGNLEILANVPLTKEEKKLDIGFFESFGNGKEGGYFLNTQLKPMKHFPKYFEVFGSVTIYGIEGDLEEAYLLDAYENEKSAEKS